MSGTEKTPNAPLDAQLGARLQMAALWVSTLFVFAYVDLFSLYRGDVIAGLAAGKVFVFDVTQGFLVFTTLYIVAPSLMVYLALVTPAAANRWLNIVVAAFYVVTIAASCIGETWAYYLIGSGVEVALLLALLLTAWRAPKRG